MATVIIFPRKEICGSNKGKDNIEREEHPASFRNLAYICPPSYTLLNMFYVLPCVTLFLWFSVLLALRLPRLGKRELIFELFCTYVRFALVWFCLFPLPLGVWEGLRFVFVALPGLFSYPFLDVDCRIRKTIPALETRFYRKLRQKRNHISHSSDIAKNSARLI